MLKIESKHKLKDAPPEATLVYVVTSGKLYRHLDGEWVEKLYFTTSEIAEMINLTQYQVQTIIRQMNLRPKIQSSKSLDKVQLKVILDTVKMRKLNMNYKEIRQKLRV